MGELKPIDQKDTDIGVVADLITQIKQNLMLVEDKTFAEKYPYLTVATLRKLPRLLDAITCRLDTTERVATYHDYYSRRQKYTSEYYTQDMFEKEDKELDAQFLQEYASKNPDKDITVGKKEVSATSNSQALLDNPEVFKLLSLMSNIDSKEEMLKVLESKVQGNMPMLSDSSVISDDINFYVTLFKLECPLYYAKEFANLTYDFVDTVRDRKRTLLATDVYAVRYVKGEAQSWDEVNVYLSRVTDIKVANIGKCNYSAETNVTELKDGIWHGILNEFVASILRFDVLIREFDKRREARHLELMEHCREKQEASQLADLERLLFEAYPQKNSKLAKKPNLPKEVLSALNCFGLSASELEKLTQKRVKEGYIQLVKIHHPDAHNNSDSSLEKTRELNNSKEVLITYLKEQRSKQKAGKSA